MAIYGYARVSTDRQAEDGESLTVQERQLQGWCLMQGEEMEHIFVDRGVSGSTPLAERPEGGALLRLLHAGDTLVAAKLDRLFRSSLDALQTVDALRRRGVRVWLLDLGGDVTGNGIAKVFMTIAAAFAELEREQIAERVRGVKRDQRDRNRFLGGKVPFGFEILELPKADGSGTERVLRHCEVEQVIIRDVLAMRAENRTFRDIQAAVEAQHRRWIALATLKRICDQGAEGEAEAA